MEKLERIMLPITLVLFIMLGLVFLTGSNNASSKKIEGTLLKAEGPANQYDLKAGEMGEVNVEVEPITLSRFQISFNTHSVPLDFDAKDVIKLNDNNGKKYTPLSWSGGTGGHHLSGEIEFSTVDSSAESITLQITGIENKELDFTWIK